MIFTSKQTIIEPKGTDWESSKTYNCAAIADGPSTILFYRAVGADKISRIGRANLNNRQLIRSEQPVLVPENTNEKNGVEDPRLTKVDGQYLLTYTAYDGISARLHWAKSQDLTQWTKLGPMLTKWNASEAGAFIPAWDTARHNLVATTDWNKSGGIFPKEIKGQLTMLFGDSHIWLAFSGDKKSWTADKKPLVSPRPGKFDSAHVEMGPPPLETKHGWLVFYHGIDNNIIYSLGYVLLDKTDPRIIIKRSKNPVLTADQSDEKRLVDIAPGAIAGLGIKPRVIFCCGAVMDKDKVTVYYGENDAIIKSASANIDDILI
jgi:predicted GH43/DUF377 family glycosyl hydrolase